MRRLLPTMILFLSGTYGLLAEPKTPEELFQQRSLQGNTAVDLMPLPQLYQREKSPLIVRMVRKEESIELLIREFAEGEGKRVHASLIHRTMKFDTQEQTTIRKFTRGGADYDTGLNTKFAEACAQTARKLIEIIDETTPRDVRDGRESVDRFSDDGYHTVLLEYYRDGKNHRYIVVRDCPTLLDDLRKEFAAAVKENGAHDDSGRR